MAGEIVKQIRITAVKFFVFAVASVMAFMLIYNTMQDAVDGKQVDYHAIFSDVSGLRVGDNVRVAGVQVGKVESIEVKGRQAEIGFTLRETQPLLDTTELVIRYQNLLGQRYMSLIQGPKRGTKVPPGATVPINRTSGGFDLTGLLNGFRPLFDVLKPEDVNQLAKTIVQVLQGEGGTVEQLLAETTKLTNFLADRDDIFNQVVTNLTPVLQNLDGQGDAINTTVSELNSLMTGLASQRQTIGESISQLSMLINQTSDFLVDARAPSVQLLKSLRAVAGMFAANLEALRGGIQGFPKILNALGRAGSYRNALNVYVCRIGIKLGGVDAYLPLQTGGPYSKVCGG